jgi:hypothetical protein
MKLYKNTLLVLLLLLHQNLYAQKSSILDQTVTIKLTNERLDVALKRMSEIGNFSFSYNSDAFDVAQRVNINAQARSIRQLLDDIFKGDMVYKERRGYVILSKKEAANVSKDLYINGYVSDLQTGEKIPQASIFERQTLASAITNHYGYYRIKIPVAMASTRLEVRKENYKGQSVNISGRSSINVALKPTITDTDTIPKPTDTPIDKIIKLDTQIVTPTKPKIKIDTQLIITKIDTTHPTTKKPATWNNTKRSFVDALASVKQAIHIDNIGDTLYRPFQISFLPFIGTNHILSGNIINALSFNILAGYSLGVNGVEMGGVLNLVRRDIKGLQMSGMGNLVGRDVDGLQMAGTFNVVGRRLDGMQMAGAVNVGIGEVTGMQVAGFANVAIGKLRGWQFAPYNFARVVADGHQIGVFNYADSSATTPFGFISFVRKNGYRRLELSTDELNYLNLSFKTGVHRFYNIFTAGFSFLQANKPVVSLGYGVGTALNFGRGWLMNLDGVGSTFTRFDEQTLADFTQHFRLSASIEKKISRHVALAAGPSLNWLVSDGRTLNTDRSYMFNFLPTRTFTSGKVLNTWVGLQVALRFCNR